MCRRKLRPPGYTNHQSGTGDKKIALPKCALPIDSTPPDPESHGSSTPPTPAPTPTLTPRPSPLPSPSARPRKIPRISPVRGFRRIVTGRSVSSSNLTDPPGPLSVIPASSPSHPTRTGSAKTNDDLPSPSPTSGIAKLNENNSSPSTSHPTISNSPPDRGIAAGASTTNAGSRNGVPSDPTPPHSSRLFAGTATREDTSPPPASVQSVTERVGEVILAHPSGPAAAVGHQIGPNRRQQPARLSEVVSPGADSTVVPGK